jgi:nickel/cobalt exporter
MINLPDLISQGSGNLWVFIPSAILLGALHGLEPGHSKTMMAAFIIAVRGTVKQAVMLGLAATASHTLIVWLVALGGLYFGRHMNIETSEPYFQMASAALIFIIAGWMVWRTWAGEHGHDHHEHEHDHQHGHHHHHGERLAIDTGHGIVNLEICEEGLAPRWRVWPAESHGLSPDSASIETVRSDGRRQAFALARSGPYFESLDAIPEPHDFTARVTLSHGNHSHEAELVFADHGPAHHHDHQPHAHGIDLGPEVRQDEHARAHAEDIQRRFDGRPVTTGQIVLFGLTGGLIPCPAAITVLLVCLQLKRLTLGVTLVLCFSIGLALTMVTAGTVAALSLHHVQKRWSGFDALARRAPYASAVLIICIGLYISFSGLRALY